MAQKLFSQAAFYVITAFMKAISSINGRQTVTYSMEHLCSLQKVPIILAIWDYSTPFSEPDIFNGLLVVHMVRFEVAVGHKKTTIFPPLSIKS
jgi:hypothetical protein